MLREILQLLRSEYPDDLWRSQLRGGGWAPFARDRLPRIARVISAALEAAGVGFTDGEPGVTLRTASNA